jgi:hypothetical protein
LSPTLFKIRRLIRNVTGDFHIDFTGGREGSCLCSLRVLAALRQRPVLTLKYLRDETFPTATKAMQTLVAAASPAS